MERVRVYVVDDHEVVRRGVRAVLTDEADMDIVGESGTMQVALREIPRLSPHVVVLDARLRDGSAAEVCRALHASAPHVRALVLTAAEDDDGIVAALRAGASGYLLTTVGGVDLVGAVRRTAAGQSVIDPRVASRVLEHLRATPAPAPVLAPLSGQERKVLVLIAEGMSNRQIATALVLSEKTVKNYVSNVLMKLELQSRTQAAVLAMRVLAGGPDRRHEPRATRALPR